MKFTSFLLGFLISIAWYLVQNQASDPTSSTATRTTNPVVEVVARHRAQEDHQNPQQQEQEAEAAPRRETVSSVTSSSTHASSFSSSSSAESSKFLKLIKDSRPWHLFINATKRRRLKLSKRKKGKNQLHQGTMESNSSNSNNSTLGYAVSEINVGVLASNESKTYAEQVAKDVRGMFPDRFKVVVLDGSSTESWPKLQVMVLATMTNSSFPYDKAQQYVEQCNQEDNRSPFLVLTDLDLKRNLSDRRILYNVLSAGGLMSYLPRYAYASRDGFVGGNNQHDPHLHSRGAQELEIADRQDQIEVNGMILLKPVLERPVDPTDAKVRVYYPRSEGGGCKVIKFTDEAHRQHIAKFEASVEHIQQGPGFNFIYEELSDVPLVKIRKKERPAERLTKFVKLKTDKSTAVISSFGDDEEVSYESDLSRLDRKIVIVTTASMPWMTGTAVNPLLRAAYLKRGRPEGSVTLVIPWLDKQDDQAAVYGHHRYSSPEEQEKDVRGWLKDQAGMPEEADSETGIKILWYPSRYVSALGSIFPTGDICSIIPDEDADICILEEPEHLNWIRGSKGEEGEIWTEKFKHVVGVIHTNYRAYASQTSAGLIAAPFITGLSTLMVRAYCDKVIKLSATLQTYSPEKEVVCNVHGVRSDFLDEGKRRSQQTRLGVSPEVDESSGTPKAYFIGKLLWDKGLDHLLRLEYFYKAVTGEFFPIDIVGDGPDRKEIEAAFTATDRRGKIGTTIRNLLAIDDDDTRDQSSMEFNIDKKLEGKKDSLFDVPASMLLNTGKVPGAFHGRQDHAQFCKNYRVLVNPSTTEVLCTTVAEALAMGKFVIIPRHPSNEFFYQFPNCLVYDNKVDFVKHMAYTLSNEPEPLSEEHAYIFTWYAATERLIKASAITMKEGRVRAKARMEKKDQRLAKTYNKLGAQGELLRMILDGEGPPKKSNTTTSESSLKTSLRKLAITNGDEDSSDDKKV